MTTKTTYAVFPYFNNEGIIIGFNICSLLKHFDQFSSIYQDTLPSFDAVSLCDTILKLSICHLHEVDNCNFFTNCWDTQRVGVVQYIKKSIRVSVVSHFTLIEEFIESLFIKTEFSDNIHFIGKISCLESGINQILGKLKILLEHLKPIIKFTFQVILTLIYFNVVLNVTSASVFYLILMNLLLILLSSLKTRKN